jgi:hypothetical protein
VRPSMVRFVSIIESLHASTGLRSAPKPEASYIDKISRRRHNSARWLFKVPGAARSFGI